MSVQNAEKRCKASCSEFREVWPGIKQCMVCGFSLATTDDVQEVRKGEKVKYPKEDTLHSTYHGKLYKVKAQYGYSNVLDYKVLIEKDSNILKSLSELKANDFSQDAIVYDKVFENIFSMLREVKVWVKTLKKSSEEMEETCDGLHSIVLDMWRLCKKGVDSNDISEKVDMSLKILPLYNQLDADIEHIRCSLDVRKVAKKLQPNFTFNLDKELSSYGTFVQIVPSKKSKVANILNDLYTVEFTKSIRLWDMCKAHPKFEDYVALLWNTPKFLKFIRPFMTKEQFDSYYTEYKANRQLVDFEFDDVPFYFGRVALSPACECAIKENKCKRQCSNCPLGYKDLTYTDKLVEMSDEDEDNSDGYENTEEYKVMSEVLTEIGKKFNEN